MNTRIDVSKYLTSNLGQAMLALSAASAASGLERSLLELVRLRASQINHCAYCIDMHTKDACARRNGATALLGQRVARSAVLLRARACGARMDGGGDKRRRHTRAGQRLRARTAALRRSRAGGADLRRGRHQQLEPAGGVVPGGSWDLPAADRCTCVTASHI